MSLERRIWLLGNLLLILLALFSARLAYWQLWRTDLKPVVITGLEHAPQPVLQRSADYLQDVNRGSIYDRNGRLLASDHTNADGARVRAYTDPSLSHVIGYASKFRTGLTGLEATYNDTLLGADRVDTQVAQALHQPVAGSDLILTIDDDIQQAADQALAGRPGAVIVLDAQSGAVLAMASAPNFDPNRVLEDGYAASLSGSPFLNRATQALYPPGSTWKTVALAAGLDTGQLTPDTQFDFGQPIQGPDGPYYIYKVDGGTIPDYNHTEDKLSLAMSYAKSANAAFARVGDEMPADVMINYARRFGFSANDSSRFGLEIESSPSQLAGNVEDLYSNNLLRASTAIGQGELLATPINLTMVGLAVVNDGNIPVPYFVEGIRSPSGYTNTNLANRRTLRGIIKPETAKTIREMMITAVKDGSGYRAAVPGLVVGGKTGTAQVGGNAQPHAWFLGFAVGQQRSVVICVVVENGGEGSQVAAPIFAQVAAAAARPGK